MFKKIITALGIDPHKREVENLTAIVDQVNALEPEYEALSDDALRAKTDEFRAQLAAEVDGIEDPKERRAVEQAMLNEILPHAFAAVREASKRTLGMRHYDVQLIGGMTMHKSSIAEMRTGEGKTLVATLPLYLNTITGRGVHLITVNDYLARRDARWMGPIYAALGLTVGVLQMAAVTENGKKAFIYDPTRESPQEDKDKLRLVDRVEAYAADITYGTNSEFGFDYLRDNMTMRLNERVQRGHYFAIVDEVDNVLIDEARTPLIISGPAAGDLEWYGRMAQVVRALKPEDYEVNEKDRTVILTEIGIAHVEQILGQPLRDIERPEDVTPEQARLLGYLEQSMRAQFLFKRNKEYLVQGGKVIIVDDFTGRLMPGRRWSDGLHQAVEAKEGVKVEPENITYATITLQNYFRMYEKLAGMTGTALTESEEFHKIYKLEVLPIPTNLEYNATRNNAPLVEIKAKDDEGYEFIYFARRDDPAKAPRYYRRKDFPDVIYRTAESKLRSIVTEIVRYHVMGRPLLVGTTSVDSSERLSRRLRAEQVRRLVQVMLARQAWFEANNKEEDGRLYPELQPLNETLDKLEPAALRQFVKPFGANLSTEEAANIQKILGLLRLDLSCADRLKAVLQGGVPHQVLNARKHTEESQIIAGAGAFGAVTIATNMAGRGVDIKLGGEMAEEVIAAVNRVLGKAGYKNAYDMTLAERRVLLQKVDPELYGIYDAEVKLFLQYFEDMARVKELGGLHVIGSERHESRRIDNQLRGRAARQGDPGSSRFYLSLEDDLMRMFGGEQVSKLMQSLRVDDSLPLEARIVGNIIEGSQHRVEGANFDVRKHLLEYDDVLNAQRKRIYEQRNRAFTKDDLTGDVEELLRAEVENRVPVAMADEEGPWKLLAWLDQIQPPFGAPDGIYPSFSFKLLLDELAESRDEPRQAVLNLVRRAVETENEHIQHFIETLLERNRESLDQQLTERFDALDTFLEGASETEEREPKRPQELLDDLNNVVRLPLRLNPEQQRTLLNAPKGLEDYLKEQVELVLTNLMAVRVAGAIEQRLGEALELDKDQILRSDWDGAATLLGTAAQAALAKRLERLLGSHAQVARDLEQLMQREDLAQADRTALLRLLAAVQQGRRTAFDQKTHRQVQTIYTRFHYTYFAAHLLQGRSAEHVTAELLEHLQGAVLALRGGLGEGELIRLRQSDVRVADLNLPAVDLGGVRSDVALAGLTEPERATLKEALGRYIQTQLYRQVLLQTITELWVDYLTRVEALRVSIGLEAYAQRDPLVQYKAKASEMFQNLLVEIRTAVVSRILTYQPRQYAVALNEPAPATEAPAAVPEASETVEGGKRKRRRH
jgi:preprotein translocase subunit SecA